MATAAITAERENYLNQEYGIKSWLLTVDHKRIALLYLLSITFFFFIGGFFALLIRLELLTPAGDLVQADTYNKLFTMHGQVMVFFFLIPSIPAVLGNFLVPLMIGAKDLAFPRINLLSWYLYIIAGVLMLHCMLTGGVDTGWTFYTPFSTAFSNTKVIEAGLAIFISGFSSILTGLNFVVTIHRMRAPGMTWDRLPLFIWAHYATSIIQLLGTPVIAVTLVLVVLERALHLGIFDPDARRRPAAVPAPVLVLFPSRGVHHDSALDGSGQRNYSVLLAQAHFRLQVRGPVEHQHRRFRLSGLGPPHVRGRNFALCRADLLRPQLPGCRPFGHQGLQLDRDHVQGLDHVFHAHAVRLRFHRPVHHGRPYRTVPGRLGIDVHVTDTYFVVAHFHYIMVGGAVMGYLGGMHFWWPKISGRMYPESLGRLAALIVFLGFNLTFFPQFILGYLGMPRRYWQYPPEFQVLNVLSTAGSTILAVGYLLPMVYFLWSMRYGKVAPDNPWGASGLEWMTTSPPPTFNFDDTPGGDLGSLRLREHSRSAGGAQLADSPIAVEHHNPALKHHFADMEQQRDASSLGMWLFLATEIMFFGGMFCAYLIYRYWYFPDFAAASNSLDITLGTVNTAVLICSSLTVVMAVRAAQIGQASGSR